MHATTRLTTTLALTLALPSVAAAQALATPPPPPGAPTTQSPPGEGPAQRYARGSVSLRGAVSLSAFAANSQLSVNVGTGALVRFVLPGGLVIETGLGASVTYSDIQAPSTFGPTWVLHGDPRLLVGYAAALSPTVAITPRVGVSVGASHVLGPVLPATPAPVSYRVMAEVPLTIFLGRHVFIEPAVGASIVPSTPAGPGTSLLVYFSHSFGVTF